MLSWALTCWMLALIALLLGLADVSEPAAEIAHLVLVGALVLTVASGVFHALRRGPPA